MYPATVTPRRARRLRVDPERTGEECDDAQRNDDGRSSHPQGDAARIN